MHWLNLALAQRWPLASLLALLLGPQFTRVVSPSETGVCNPTSVINTHGDEVPHARNATISRAGNVIADYAFKTSHEFLAIQRNRWLGALMIKSQRNFQSSEVYALLVLVGLFGFVVNDLFAVMEGVIMRRWPPRA
jgi:hypothetical protein